MFDFKFVEFVNLFVGEVCKRVWMVVSVVVVVVVVVIVFVYMGIIVIEFVVFV